jgi:hypothetical protein
LASVGLSAADAGDVSGDFASAGAASAFAFLGFFFTSAAGVSSAMSIT